MITVGQDHMLSRWRFNMSVEKMERYKEYKKNRKEILRKQKRQEKINKIIGIASTIIIVGAIGFFIYQDVKPKYVPDTRSLITWGKYIPAETEDIQDETEDNEESQQTETTEENQ